MTPTLVAPSFGWTELAARVPGSMASLLQRQANILWPAKVISGPSVLAEAPVGMTHREALALAHAALEHGLTVLCDERPALGEGRQFASNGDLPPSLLEGCVHEWSRNGTRLQTTRIDRTTLSAVAIRGSAVLRTDLTRLNQPRPHCLVALGHFLIALNTRIRLGRASILPDRVVAEFALPLASATPAIIDMAAEAVAVAACLAKKECAALLDDQLAQEYLRFHHIGED